MCELTISMRYRPTAVRIWAPAKNDDCVVDVTITGTFIAASSGGTDGGGAIMSVDRGSTWTRIPGLSKYKVCRLLIHQQVLYVGTSWHLARISVGEGELAVFSSELAKAPVWAMSAGSVLALTGAADGVFRSVDRGRN